MTPPIFHHNFGGITIGPDRHVGISPSINLKLFGRKVFQPTWSRYLNVMDGQTEGQTDRRHTVA